MTQANGVLLTEQVQVHTYTANAKRMVIVHAEPGWTKDQWLAATQHANVNDDYHEWQQVELNDGSEIWIFSLPEQANE